MDKNTKFLIVDDFPTMRRIVKNLLGDLGFTNTVEADDGETAAGAQGWWHSICGDGLEHAGHDRN